MGKRKHAVGTHRLKKLGGKAQLAGLTVVGMLPRMKNKAWRIYKAGNLREACAITLEVLA